MSATVEVTVGEQIELISTAIFNFAQGQFQAHGVPADLGKVILDGVRARQLDLAFNEAVNSKLPKPEHCEPVCHTGTVDDLKAELEGFYSKQEEGA